jgi:hypothetical protein
MRLVAFAICIALLSNSALGTVTIITNAAQWQAKAQNFTTLTFTDHPPFTIITNQYADAGITFTDGNDFIRATTSYSDGQGLMSIDPGGLGTIHASFDSPILSLAIEYLGGLQFELHAGGEMIFTSILYSAGFTPFVGVVSTVPFDSVIIRDYDDDIVSVDNLHFGTIPGPSAIVIVCLGAMASTPNRRR